MVGPRGIPKVLVVDVIASQQVRRRPRSRMTGDGEPGLTLCQVHCDRERRIIGETPADGIRYHLSSVGHREACVSAESDWGQRTAVDRRGSNRSIARFSHADSGDIEVVDAEDVAESKAERATAVRDLQRLPQRGILKDASRSIVWRRWEIVGFYELGHRCPATDPVGPGRILGMTFGEAVSFTVVLRAGSAKDGEAAC